MFINRKSLPVAFLVLGLAFALVLGGCSSPQQQSTPAPTPAPAKESGYPETTITLIVPTTAGGGYDLGARNVARFLPKHLPNNVNVVVNNMPGAGQMIGVHALYAAKPDGYTIGAFNAIGALMAQFIRPQETKFDVAKFKYLGMWQNDVRAIGVSNSVQAKTWDELVAKSKEKPLLCGTGGAGSGQHTDPLMVEAVSELKLKYVHYDGSAQVEPAMGRKEIEFEMGQVSTIVTLEEQKIGRPFCVLADQRVPSAPNVPTALEVGMPKEQYEKLMASPFFGVNRVIAAPPGMDPKILEILRKAVWDTFQDPEYIAEVEKMKGEYNPVKGEEYDAIALKKINSANENQKMIEIMKEATTGAK